MNRSSIFSKAAFVALVAASFFSFSRADAETIFGITDAAQLFSFDSASPGTVSSLTAVTGLTAGQSLVAIDFRPATGQLYGLSYASSGAAQLYVIDTNSGVATPVGSGLTLTANNLRFAFDFNPSVDRIRVIGGDDSNFRLNPVTGGIAATDTNVAYASGDVGFGRNPLLSAAAYTNNVAGGTPTTLYAYDFNRDVIVTVGNINGTPNSPNSGLLFTVNNAPDSTSGVTAGSGSMGFDISGATGIGYLNIDTTASGVVDSLYTVNFTTGVLSLVGAIGAPSVLDISVRPVPEPGTLAFLGLALSAGAVSAWRRRRA